MMRDVRETLFSPPRFLNILNRLEETLIGCLMAVATLIIFASVMHRYGLASLGTLTGWTRDQGYAELSDVLRRIYFACLSLRFTWAQELCVILFIWMAKFGAAYGVRTGIHAGVDILVERLPPHWRHRTVLFGLFCGALFTAIVGWLGARLVWHMWQTGQVSAVLEAPMWLVYLCVPLGSYLMCFRFLEVALRFDETGQLPRPHEAVPVASPSSTAGDTA